MTAVPKQPRSGILISMWDRVHLRVYFYLVLRLKTESPWPRVFPVLSLDLQKCTGFQVPINLSPSIYLQTLRPARRIRMEVETRVIRVGSRKSQVNSPIFCIFIIRGKHHASRMQNALDLYRVSQKIDRHASWLPLSWDNAKPFKARQGMRNHSRRNVTRM